MSDDVTAIATKSDILSNTVILKFHENVLKSRLCGVHSTQKYWNIGNVNEMFKLLKLDFEVSRKVRVLKLAQPIHRIF